MKNLKNNKKSNYKFGILAEIISLIFLSAKGYKILKWRHKTPFGEIDILARKSSRIIAIEVKYRKKSLTHPGQVLRQSQVERLRRSLEFFVSKNPAIQKYNLAIDFIAVNRFFYIKHYKNFIG